MSYPLMIRIVVGDTSGWTAQGNRNLLLFAMLVFALFAGLISWQGHRQRVELATVVQLANSKLRGNAASPTLDGTHPCLFASVSADVAIPSIGRCATPTTHGEAVDRFEVDLRYGTFVLRQTDLQLNDVFSVPLTRTYNSDDWLPLNKVHAFGRNTNHPYDIAPLGTRNPYTHMMLALEDGDMLYFPRVSEGSGYSDAIFQHVETSTQFYKSTINWNGNGWTLRLTNGSEILFPESYSANNLAQGAATEIRNASGDVLELKRDWRRNLQEILTPHGHWIRFAYDNQSRITRVADDQGNSIRYAYNTDGDGMLQYAISSSGKERHYVYRKWLMMAILDGQGNTLVRNIYKSGVLVGQVYGNGDTYEYRYVLNSKRTYADKVIITFPDHHEQEIEVGDSVSEYLHR